MALEEAIGSLVSLKKLYLNGNQLTDKEKARIRGLLPPTCDLTIT